MDEDSLLVYSKEDSGVKQICLARDKVRTNRGRVVANTPKCGIPPSSGRWQDLGGGGAVGRKEAFKPF